MAKIEVSDDQLKKFMDEATKNKVKDLEKQVKNLTAQVNRQKANAAIFKERSVENEHAMEYLHNLAADLNDQGYGPEYR